jgi:hypothetical protein
VDSPVDAACALSLCSTMLFPAPSILEGEIMIGVGQHMPFSFLPELEGDAITFEDFFRRVVAEVSSPLIRCFRAPEYSAMLHPGNPRNRLLTMSVKLQKPNFGALLQLEKRGIFQDNEQLSRLKKAVVFEFFEAH